MFSIFSEKSGSNCFLLNKFSIFRGRNTQIKSKLSREVNISYVPKEKLNRITRKNHEVIPIAYDIVDNFSLFPRQSAKRLTVYKKLEYDIYNQVITINSNSDENNIIYQVQNNPMEKIEKKKSKKNKKIEVTCEIVSDEE